jgi:hypothetical protein
VCHPRARHSHQRQAPAPGPRIPALARAPHPRTATNALLLASVEANLSRVRLEMPAPDGVGWPGTAMPPATRPDDLQ